MSCVRVKRVKNSTNFSRLNVRILILYKCILHSKRKNTNGQTGNSLRNRLVGMVGIRRGRKESKAKNKYEKKIGQILIPPARL